jgi:nicotinamidase-related amidase
MARRHTKLGYSHSDIIDFQVWGRIKGGGRTAGTASIHTYLQLAADSRRHAQDISVCSHWHRPDHIGMARHALRKARERREAVAL